MPGDSPLKHKPFSSLRGVVASAGAAQPRANPAEAQSLGRVVVREEHDEQSGAPICRVIGLPANRLNATGKLARDALGIAVVIEGRELLVMDGDCERAAAWFRDAGASEVVVIRRQQPATACGEPGGTDRSQIKRGMRVAIVQKADQETGALTEGVVREILTSSPTHPRGIKVRLETGQVGRVRRILGVKGTDTRPSS